MFTRTKHGANRVAEYLDKRGIHAAAIHGNKSQNARERRSTASSRGACARWSPPTSPPAASTSISSRFVINFDLPNIPEAYVHRIGRTGRAGAAGRAMSFCEQEERPYLADIERLIRMQIAAVTKHPYPSPLGIPPATDLDPKRHHGRTKRTCTEKATSRPDAPPTPWPTCAWPR